MSAADVIPPPVSEKEEGAVPGTTECAPEEPDCGGGGGEVCALDGTCGPSTEATVKRTHDEEEEAETAKDEEEVLTSSGRTKRHCAPVTLVDPQNNDGGSDSEEDPDYDPDCDDEDD